MRYLVSSEEMKRCDKTTIEKIGIPSLILMERAALAVVEELNCGEFDLSQILIVCGIGNNGGDGLAIGRILTLRGYQVKIVIVGDINKGTDEVISQIRFLESYGIELYDTIPSCEYTTIIDTVFGSGLSRPVEGVFADMISKINELQKPVLSVDLPSGISANTGEVMGICVKAKKTIALAYKKLGTSLFPGADFAGKVVVKDIGIYELGFQGRYPLVKALEIPDLNMLPKRKAYSNKGSYGKVLLIAGSYNMSGAAYLAAKAAYVTGAGLVRIVTPNENREILQTLLPEAIMTTYTRGNLELDTLSDLIEWADVIGIGPGIGVTEDSKEILQEVLLSTEKPLVIDADALNIIAKNPELLKTCKSEIIITPHLGEMGRLINKEIQAISKNTIYEAYDFAKEHNLVCILKDTRTVITNGKDRTFLNESGNNGMATAGSGDVLTGIVTALLGQGLSAIDAAALGAYIHGLGGDYAAKEKGTYSLMAQDIINYLANVLNMDKKTNKKIAKDDIRYEKV